MTDHAPAEVVPQRASRRITGLDIARAFAIIGMVLVNFKVTMGADSGDPGWLRMFAALFDGRAAATFVVLAGIGASLGSRRARLSRDTDQQNVARVTLAKRGLFLFVLGWLFYQVWPADILHFYGVYLAIGAIVLFASSRMLIGLATAATAVAFLFIVTFDPFANWDLTDLSYVGITTPAGFLRNLFFDGFHPVFPWIAFYLFGMWLGRTDLRDRLWRRTLAIWSGVIVVVGEVAAWFVLGPKGSSLTSLDGESWRWLFSVEPIPPLPLYLAVGGATAVLVIMGSIWIGEHVSARVMQPLVSTGQLALTIYVAHIFVGMGVLESMGRLEDQTLSWAVGTSIAFSIAAIVFSWVWRRHFERGPLEWTMRRIAG
ncbi:MAG: heparan-alpha-glucosaminide N-acetyltransferase domain-containing protein [Actinomycetia bacterium]|nr:heparan-alpha-glucosaminide N-acetyltransferase domain-containing protein [Actinomycetes bacterium]